MNTSDLHKVAGMLSRLGDAAKADRPGETRAGRALAFGGLGAGLGAAGGYINTASQFASNPFAHPKILEAIANRPGFMEKLFGGALSGKAIDGMALHKELLPSIAKAMPKKLAIPALALGGLGGLAGLLSKVQPTTPGERLSKLKG